MDALQLGVAPCAFVIRDVIRHEQSGLLVDPKRGIVYGAAGTPVGGVCGDGYVRLGARGTRGCLYAHRLVYEAVHGHIPVGLEIDHLNGRKADNRIRNLEAVTKSENARRAVAKGFAPVGEARSDSKLTAALVREIRRTVGEKTSADWARELGVGKATIRKVREGTTWRHVKARGRPRKSPPSSRRRRRPKG